MLLNVIRCKQTGVQMILIIIKIAVNVSESQPGDLIFSNSPGYLQIVIDFWEITIFVLENIWFFSPFPGMGLVLVHRRFEQHIRL